ncbi:MAG: hypothetical protein V4590_09100 [Bacteroidota bacterium]
MKNAVLFAPVLLLTGFILINGIHNTIAFCLTLAITLLLILKIATKLFSEPNRETHIHKKAERHFHHSALR